MVGDIYKSPIGSIYHLYTTYSPCLLSDYISPIPPIKGTRKQLLIYGCKQTFARHLLVQPGSWWWSICVPLDLLKGEWLVRINRFGVLGWSTSTWQEDVLNTLQGTNISFSQGAFEDDFPFLQVGYVSPLEGCFFFWMGAAKKKTSAKKSLGKTCLFCSGIYICTLEVQFHHFLEVGLWVSPFFK